MRTRWWVSLILHFLCQQLCVLAFNLDPRIPVVKSGTAGSYFGYSVAEHITLAARPIPRILVGAPKAQSGQPGTNHSGAIYDCPLTPLQNDCQKLSIDDFDEVDSDELKDDQWLGVSLKSEGIGGQVVACAHRYVKQSEYYRWGLGICYALTQRLDQDNVFDPCANKDKTRAHETYGYCQVGTSLAISADRDVILGTPGVFTWRGTIYTNNLAPKADKAWYTGPLDQFSPVDKYSYLGMSVTTGRFFDNQMYFVAGAPRAANKGQVVFFTKEKNQMAGSPLTVRTTLQGELFASSFGYELAAADLNGDGLPDLIVGAPFYYGKDAGGAIYVYMNKDVGINDNTNYTKRITGKEESRFGFAIANCSDLNKDGYEDIAVGAPYEGNGVVYIFLGSMNGIIETPAQIITVEDLPVYIQSFGYSLSGGMDLDNNHYPDLVVGAYESSKIIVLRARPIIHIVSSVEGSELQNIRPDTTGCRRDPHASTACFTFDACFIVSFNESINNPSVTMNYTIEAETFLPGKRVLRVFFKNAANPEKGGGVIHKQITLPANIKNHQKCSKETAYLRETFGDRLSPIKFKLTYVLDQDEPVFLESHRILPQINRYPILNQPGAVKIFEASFHKNCGIDDICQSIIELDAKLDQGPAFVLGESELISLTITASSVDEPAYEAYVFVTYPLSLSYSRLSEESKTAFSCFEPIRVDNVQVMNCSLGNPFASDNGLAKIIIYFDTTNVLDTDLELVFEVSANSTSVMRKEAIQTPKLQIVRQAELSIDGRVAPDQVQYRGEIRGATAMVTEDDVGPPFVHSYSIINDGPSSVSSVWVDISWPFEIDDGRKTGKYIFYLMEKPKISGAYGECFVDDEHINFLGLLASTNNITFGEFNWALDRVSPSEKDDTSAGAGRGPTVDPAKGGHEDYDGSYGETTHTKTSETISTKKETSYKETHSTSYHSSSSGGSRITSSSSSGHSSSGVSHQTYRGKRDVQPQAEALTESSNVVTLECREGSARCLNFRCQIRNLLAGTRSSASIKIRGRLWSSTFISDFSEVDHVNIVSQAVMKIESILDIKQDTSNDQAKIITKAVPDIPQSQKASKIPIWVYILAACVGLILLLLVILCLWKLGFFKRKTPDATMKASLEKQNEFNSHNY